MSGFSHRKCDSLHGFTSNLAWPTGTRVPCLYIISRQSAQGMGVRPQNIEHFHFLENSRLAGVTPLTDLECFRFFCTTTYPTLTFQIWLDSLHRIRSNCWETARRSIRPNLSVHIVGKTTRWIEKCLAPF